MCSYIYKARLTSCKVHGCISWLENTPTPILEKPLKLIAHGDIFSYSTVFSWSLWHIYMACICGICHCGNSHFTKVAAVFLYLAFWCSYSGQVACNFGIHWFVRLMVPDMVRQRSSLWAFESSLMLCESVQCRSTHIVEQTLSIPPPLLPQPIKIQQNI